MVWRRREITRYRNLFASCVRDVTSSLRNDFRRWYSTVLGLMKSCAAISRLVLSVRRETGDLRLLWRELIERVDGPLARLLARRLELDPRALCEGLHPEVREELEGSS